MVRREGKGGFLFHTHTRVCVVVKHCVLRTVVYNNSLGKHYSKVCRSRSEAPPLPKVCVCVLYTCKRCTMHVAVILAILPIRIRGREATTAFLLHMEEEGLLRWNGIQKFNVIHDLCRIEAGA